MKTLLSFFTLLCVTLSTAADGGVHGRVYGQDEKGDNLGPLAGARIELKSETGGTAATVTTNIYGYYQIATLAAGAYRYKVAAAGFRDEDEQRGFAMPQDTREYVHDFLLTRERKLGSGPAQSNVVQPAVHGRVYGQDEKGENLGPLPGAKIELLSGQGGTVVATATANSPGGYYEIKNLSPADYAYRVSAAGFQTEDAGRGFMVPKGTLEYVHDFLLSKTPPKRDRCDLAILVVKRISTGNNRANDARLPVANAKLILQPTGNLLTPINQPFVTDAKGEYMAKLLGEGDYTVAIDAPECEPFTGPLKVVCDKDGEVIFELQPCNELLHGYVRAMLTDGWGNSASAKAAADRAYQRALKADDKGDCSVNYASALAQISAGDYNAAQQNLAAAIGKKQDGTVWDRACEARLWMNLCLHQPAQALREIRSLVQNHYATRAVTPAAKDTAHVCGIALGLFKGPWKDQIGAGDAVLLEGELLSALKGELKTECARARDHVAVEYGKLKSAEDAARNALMVGVTENRNAEVARMAERQTMISRDVAALDADIQTLQATVNAADQNYRIQATGFMQQRQQNALQLAPMQARMQQISACMAQDQVNLQGAQQPMQQTPTLQPGMRPGMMQPGMGGQAILAEIQQHQIELQQLQAQMVVIQNQDAQMAAQIVNLQNQYNASVGTAQASLNTKLRQREVMANEFDTLDRQRTAPFDPAAFSTPEIDDLVRRENALKTYDDLPLEPRREELLDQFDCGAAKEAKRPANTVMPIAINEPAFTVKRPAATFPAATPTSSRPLPALAPLTPAPAPDMRQATPTPQNPGMPPLKPLPASAMAVKPPPNLGDPAEVVVTNNHTGAVRIFGLAPGAENQVFVRSLQSGEEAMIPAKIGQTFIIKATTGGQELQRHTIGKKLEVLKLGGAR
ncbi:MAG: carboxypeptidase regulatory-like domain-containing protein [Prosthecobacter sp.]|uniref:carboxypeptidase regulatory-like domain-containing protein n=1 Tax=Prosthecobacter sp. TaxID=1965333 RepID=UPI0039040EE1